MHFVRMDDGWRLYFNSSEIRSIERLGYLSVGAPSSPICMDQLSVDELRNLSLRLRQILSEMSPPDRLSVVFESSEGAHPARWQVTASNSGISRILAVCSSETEARLEARRLANEHGYRYTPQHTPVVAPQPGDQDVENNRVFMGNYWVEFPMRRMCDYLSAAVRRGANPEYQCQVSNDPTSGRYLVEAFPALLSGGGAPERRYELLGVFYQASEAFDYGNRLGAELRLISGTPTPPSPHEPPSLPDQEKPMIRSRRRTMI